MKLVSRVIAVLLFIIFFGFALKNTQEVALRFFLDYEIRGPLVLMLLGFFAAGATLGVLALTPTVFRHRRDRVFELDARQIPEPHQKQQHFALAGSRVAHSAHQPLTGAFSARSPGPSPIHVEPSLFPHRNTRRTRRENTFALSSPRSHTYPQSGWLRRPPPG